MTTTAGNGVPYCMKTTKTADQMEIRGGGCESPARPITYLMDVTAGFTCAYQREAPIFATFTTYPNDATATQSEVEFKLESGGFLCPSVAKLDASMTLLEAVSGKAAYVS